MTQTTTIPQAVWDHYHACYNNQTYTAFSTALATALGLDDRVVRLEAHDEDHHRIMNLLIDASMELLGAEYHAGAGGRLADALGGLDEHTPALVKFAVDHLNHFVPGERSWEAREQIAHMATLALAESVRRALVRTLDHAALLPGWRGTAPYYWLLACSLLVQSAEIVLRRDSDAGYLAEKFGKGIEMLARGTEEFVRYSVSPPLALQSFHAQLAATPNEGHRHASR